MKKISPLGKKQEERIVQSARDFLSDLMEQGPDIEEGSPEEAELDRRMEEILQNWERHKEHMESEEKGMVVEKLYTPEEVAEHLNKSLKTIRKYLRDATLKGVKVGREWRVRERDLQAYIDGLNGKGKR